MKRGWERENFISEWGTSTPHIQKEYNLTYSRKYGSTLLQKQKLKDILTFSIRFSFWFYQRWKSQSLFVCFSVDLHCYYFYAHPVLIYTMHRSVSCPCLLKLSWFTHMVNRFLCKILTYCLIDNPFITTANDPRCVDGEKATNPIFAPHDNTHVLIRILLKSLEYTFLEGKTYRIWTCLRD